MKSPKDVGKLLDNNESMVMVFKPTFWPFMLSRILDSLFYSFLIFFFVGGTIYFMAYLSFIPGSSNIPHGMGLFIYFISLIFFFIPFMILTLRGILNYKNLYYIITNKRIIIRKGSIYITHVVIKPKNIEKLRVRKGIIDKIFRTCTIDIKTHKLYQSMENVNDCDMVHNKILGLINDLY